jgi:hypothetical protein
MCNSTFQGLRGQAEHLGEFLGVRLDEVWGGAIERIDERRQRAARRVDRDPARQRGQRGDDVGVPARSHSGR